MNSIFFYAKLAILKILANSENTQYQYYSYQKKFLQNNSRFKLWLKSRQIGGTWAASLDILLESFIKGVPSIVLTANSRLLDEFHDQLNSHIQSLQLLFPDFKVKLQSKSRIKIPSLDLSSFSSITSKNKISHSFPFSLTNNFVTLQLILSNPRTARGFHGSVLLDEFAFHQDPKSIFYSVFPMITRKVDYSLFIISSPNSIEDFFYLLCKQELKKQKNSSFSFFKTSLIKAIDDGLPIDINTLKDNMDDLEFRRAYLCEFLESPNSIFSLDLINSSIQEDHINNDISLNDASLFMGVDIGRKHDLSVLSLLEQRQNKLFVRKILVLDRIPFKDQLLAIQNWISFYNPILCSIDARGMGMPLAESLSEKYPGKILEIFLTSQLKESIVYSLKWALIHKKLILLNDPILKSEFLAIQIHLSSLSSYIDGNISGSHCDRFWSVAFAFFASLKSLPKSDHFFQSQNFFRKKIWKDSLFL